MKGILLFGKICEKLSGSHDKTTLTLQFGVGKEHRLLLLKQDKQPHSHLLIEFYPTRHNKFLFLLILGLGDTSHKIRKITLNGKL